VTHLHPPHPTHPIPTRSGGFVGGLFRAGFIHGRAQGGGGVMMVMVVVGGGGQGTKDRIKRVCA
jgi:hypothetical protein